MAYHRRLPRGARINNSGHRTVLAVANDSYAATLITTAIDAKGGWVARLVASPASSPIDRGGLSQQERALQQAMYYDQRIYFHGRPAWNKDGSHNPNPDRTHALKVQWARVRVADRRVMRFRVISIGEASLYAQERFT